MPPRDAIHEIVKQALTKDGWIIKDTDTPMSYLMGRDFCLLTLEQAK
ncbi:element excision factor XisH family protein [Brunnivagina elsteri]